MTKYPVKLRREEDQILVSCPDVPGVHTFGADEDAALTRAVEALETMLNGHHDGSRGDSAPLPGEA